MPSKPTKITVNLGANSYPILIGAGLLADLPPAYKALFATQTAGGDYR